MKLLRRKVINMTKKAEDFDLKITHPDKPLYHSPEMTKLDILNYYDQVAKRMFPYLDHRLLTVVRCPDGIIESCFYMKHPNHSNENIQITSIEEESGEKGKYFYLNDEKGILYQNEMNTLEFHSWGSQVKNLEKPDLLIFDLDPDQSLALDKVQKGARDLKDLLDDYSLTSYLKTSGGKGYHILVPIKTNSSWDELHNFAGKIANKMEEKRPENYTSSSKKEDRKSKIFIDWLRNARGATIVAPYSLRARKGAKVSMPIAWDELDSVAPDAIDMEEALNRIEKEDPWKNFFDEEQELN